VGPKTLPRGFTLPVPDSSRVRGHSSQGRRDRSAESGSPIATNRLKQHANDLTRGTRCFIAFTSTNSLIQPRDGIGREHTAIRSRTAPGKDGSSFFCSAAARPLAVWAAGLTPVYVEGALGRALRLAQQPPPIAVLAEAEYEALEDAEQLETAAEADRRAADLDKAAAAAARADAERIRRERLAAECALAAVEEAAATMEADAHQQAARNARAAAATRRRTRQADATPRKRSKQRGSS
jgi:hypothetical protein